LPREKSHQRECYCCDYVHRELEPVFDELGDYKEMVRDILNGKKKGKPKKGDKAKRRSEFWKKGYRSTTKCSKIEKHVDLGTKIDSMNEYDLEDYIKTLSVTRPELNLKTGGNRQEIFYDQIKNDTRRIERANMIKTEKLARIKKDFNTEIAMKGKYNK
jgi:hypothetical protein